MDCSPLGSSVHGVSQARIPEMGCHFLLQGIFPTQGWNPSLLHWQADSLPWSHQGDSCYMVGSRSLSILYRVSIVNVRQSQSPNSSKPSFLSWYSYICSLCLSLYFCSASKITYIIFLDCMYMCYYMIFFSLSDLLHFTSTASKFIHVSTNDLISFLFMTE